MLSSSNHVGGQCVIGPNGELLDAKEIEWRHDPDDLAPINCCLPSSSSSLAAPLQAPNSTICEGKY